MVLGPQVALRALPVLPRALVDVGTRCVASHETHRADVLVVAHEVHGVVPPVHDVQNTSQGGQCNWFGPNRLLNLLAPAKGWWSPHILQHENYPVRKIPTPAAGKQGHPWISFKGQPKFAHPGHRWHLVSLGGSVWRSGGGLNIFNSIWNMLRFFSTRPVLFRCQKLSQQGLRPKLSDSPKRLVAVRSHWPSLRA